MHRTEMALRTNLLPNGVQQKVRPLNDAKAIANGANAISEGFLFFVAAALILGETYRGSRKKAEQRDRTEDSLNQLKEQVENMASVLGIDLEELQHLSEQEQDGSNHSGSGSSNAGLVSNRRADGNGDVTEEADPSLVEARLKVYRDKQDEDLKNRQLQAAVSVLLNLALKNRWVVGPEALELESILGNRQTTLATASTSPTHVAQNQQPPSTSNAIPERGSAASTSSSGDDESALRPSIIQQVALERAKALAREVRSPGETDSQPLDVSLANLLAQHGQTAST